MIASLSAPAARAASPVRIEGVGADERRALREVLPDRDAPQSLLEAERLAEEAADRARLWLRSEGYYSGTVEPFITEAPLEAALRINAGRRYSFTPPSTGFETPVAPEAEAAARRALGLVEGDAPGRAAAVLAAEADAVAALRDAGYPAAEALPRRVVVDHAAGTVAAAFAFRAGERARLGDLRAEPDDLVLPRVVARLQTWERGALYRPDLLAGVRNDLSGTGVFAGVTVTMDEAAGPDGARDVVATLTPGEPRSIALGGAYSTLEGFGVDASYALRNRMRRAETMTVSARIAEFERRIGGELRLPHALGPGRARTVAAEYAEENLEPFERQGARISTTVEGRRREGLALNYGFGVSADMFESASGEQTAYTASAFGEARFDTTDSPLDARTGGLTVLRLEPGYAAGDADVGFLRATAETRRYVPFGDRFTVAGRVEGGWVAAITGTEEDLPLDRRFYAGGGGSVRGYEFNAIFPEKRRALDQPPGGQGLWELGLEGRLRVFDKWGLAAFVDGGSAFDEFEDATDLRWGAGIGLRYDLGFAPLRIDIAAPLNPRDGDPPVAFYVSLGQAF